MNSKMIKCEKCNLYINQLPQLSQTLPGAVMIVGLSAKKATFEDMIPLDGRTRSGKLVDDMEIITQKHGLKLYRTNLVKCVPLDETEKLRYPSKNEIDQCFDHIMTEINEIQPPAIILLGKMVQDAFEKRWGTAFKNINGLEFKCVSCHGYQLVPVYHPSYILRSKKRREEYLQNYDRFISDLKESENE